MCCLPDGSQSRAPPKTRSDGAFPRPVRRSRAEPLPDPVPGCRERGEVGECALHKRLSCQELPVVGTRRPGARVATILPPGAGRVNGEGVAADSGVNYRRAPRSVRSAGLPRSLTGTAGVRLRTRAPRAPGPGKVDPDEAHRRRFSRTPGSARQRVSPRPAGSTATGAGSRHQNTGPPAGARSRGPPMGRSTDSGTGRTRPPEQSGPGRSSPGEGVSRETREGLAAMPSGRVLGPRCPPYRAEVPQSNEEA